MSVRCSRDPCFRPDSVVSTRTRGYSYSTYIPSCISIGVFSVSILQGVKKGQCCCWKTVSGHIYQQAAVIQLPFLCLVSAAMINTFHTFLFAKNEISCFVPCPFVKRIGVFYCAILQERSSFSSLKTQMLSWPVSDVACPGVSHWIK